MKTDLANGLVRSHRAMETALELIANRYAADASALGKGTRRELGRVIAGLASCRRAIEADASLVVASVLEITAADERALPRIVELVSMRSRSWDEIGELLALEGFLDEKNRAYRRPRLIHLSIAAAGSSRYAFGTPYRPEDDPNGAHAETGGRMFDLFNLPREVGGAGGLAPIVRACYDGAPRYSMAWRFATPTDLISDIDIVDDDADLPDDIEGVGFVAPT